MVCVTVTGMPILNKALTRSAARSAIRLASSWTVIASGTMTSRTCLAAGPDCWCERRSFSRARRGARGGGRGLVVRAPLLRAGAAERGERAGAAAVVVARKGAGDGELAGVTAVVA